MQFVDVVVGAAWAGAGAGHTPTGTEASSALLAVAITAGVLLWGRRIDRQRATKILPFRRPQGLVSIRVAISPSPDQPIPGATPLYLWVASEV